MTETAEMIDPMTGEIIDQKELAEALLEQAREQGVSLLGPGGLLAGLTKNVLESALEAEITEHLGHERHGPAEKGNVRNGTRSKTVFTEVGPVEIDVPRDREGSFEPQIVKKRQRRLDGIDELVLSLTARGLTTGEIAAHFDDVYGATVSKDTISRITEKVSEEMAEWTNRPLDRVYPVLFIDAIHVKVRDGQVRNKPFYIVLGVTVNGERDILGIWAGDGGGEGAKYWLGVLTEIKNRGVEDVCIGLRRAQGLARGDHYGLGTGHRADVRDPPDPQHFPLRAPPALGRALPGPQARIHRPDRGGSP
jgi:putative transposase